MGDRARLKQTIYRDHLKLYPGQARTSVRCPWCANIIDREKGADLHEALVHRGALHKDKQHLLFVRENCILLHRGCHMDHGQSGEMTRRCLKAICIVVGAARVGEWYVSLWKKHGLHVAKGILTPPKLVKVYAAMQFLKHGEILGNRDLPSGTEWMINARDYRALCIHKWMGKTTRKDKRPPKEWAGVKTVDLVSLINDGYYFTYLAQVFGFTPKEVLD